MSEIEGDAKAILCELVQGTASGISPAEQRALARWAVLKAMIEEEGHHEKFGIDKATLLLFRASESPPPNWFVFLGRATGQPRLQCGAICTETSLNGEKVVLHATSIWIRDLFIHVQGFAAAQPISPIIESNKVVQVWPLIDRTILWPLMPEVTLAEAMAIATPLERYISQHFSGYPLTRPLHEYPVPTNLGRLKLRDP